MTSPRPSPSQSQFTATVETERHAAHRLADAFAECFAAEAAVSIVDIANGRWRVILYFGRTIDAESVRAAAVSAGIAASELRFGRVAAADWVEKSLAGLKPVEAGRFVVHGAHDRTRIAPHRIGIEIEAALAFGTGHHGTTRGCLLALDSICKARTKPRPTLAPHPEVRGKRSAEHLRMRETNARILDLGTGSGVLAIAAARALQRRVLATDVDPQAVRAARDNARRNNVGPLVEVVRADGVAALGARAPFELVFANILLAPLQRFATALTQKLAPGARVVLSGVLPAQANAVVAAYHALTLQRRIDLDGWTTLVFARAPTLPSTPRSC